jgi:hypothetical protein
MTRSPLATPAPGSDHETDLIRAALQRQADRAPDPEPVLAAPSPTGRGHRPRFALVAAAAAAAVAVTAGTVTAFTGPDGAQPAATAPPTSGLPTTATVAAVRAPTGAPSTPARLPGATAATRIRLEFSPTRLPAGLREYMRIGLVEGTKRRLARQWGPDGTAGTGDGALLVLAVNGAPSGVVDGGTKVTVDGVPGRYLSAGPDDKASVEWQARPGVWLLLTQAGLGLDRAGLLGIAGSMRPDPGSYAMPFRVADTSRPAGRGPVYTFHTIARGSADWSAELVAGAVTVTRGTAAVQQGPAGGRPVEVAGRTGRYSVNRVGDVLTTWLVVPLGDGEVLTLRAGPFDGPSGSPPATPSPTHTPDAVPTGAGGVPVPEADMIALAEAVDVRSAPDVGWAR